MSTAAHEVIAGRIVAAHGRHYVVTSDAGERLVCFTRGKKSVAACGDRVDVQRTGVGQGVLVAIQARASLMSRSDGFRSKLVAANITQVLIIVATAPPFSEDLLGRTLVAAETLAIPARIVFNKIDLVDNLDAARARLAPYRALGYPVDEISVRAARDSAHASLIAHLAGNTTLLVGQSGMGKSSLLNLLVPDADAATREISEALQTGKHTTTDARLYDLPAAHDVGKPQAQAGSLIDTPGFQEFGLAHLSPGEIERAFPELRPLLGHCRFYNCSHLAEPGCVVREAVERGEVRDQRYALFATLTRESSAFRTR